MNNKNRTSLKSICRAFACLLVFFTAAPVAAAEDFELVCGVAVIEDSFKQLELNEDKIKELQKQLRERKLPDVEDSGKLDKKTREALSKFCLQQGSEGNSIPATDPEDPTAKLADFLVGKLNEISEKPAAEEAPPMPCDVALFDKKFSDSINKSFPVTEKKREEIGKIQILLKAGGFLTDRADGLLGAETYNALARLCRYLGDKGLLLDASSEDKDPANALLERLTADNAKAAAKVRAVTEGMLQDQTSLISLFATEDCGCSRDFQAQQVRVYGFLPYWLADGTPQTVDFSTLDHIGFHALRLNKDGNIPVGSLWSQASKSGSHIAKFISTAHRHRVKVDVTFYMSNWMDWKGEDGAGKIENAVKAIEKSFNQEFSDTSDDEDVGANLLSLLRKILPFVEDNSTVRADGINIYFDKYENSGDARLLISIVKALAAKIPDVKFNIMLGLNWAGIYKIKDGDFSGELKGITPELFTNLKPILEDVSETDEDTASETDTKSDSLVGRVENLFVFLPRNTDTLKKNTSKSKKLLRRAIEDAFDGDGKTRRTVLRKIIPILPTSQDAVLPHYFDKAYQGRAGQFVDDLIYLQDNFAGVGLWPLPMTPAGDDAKSDDATGDAPQDAAAKDEGEKTDGPTIDAEIIGKRIIEEYVKKGGLSLVSPEIGFFTEKLCEFACPNRWLFRLAFDFLGALLVIYGLLAVGNCRLREIYQQKFRYFAGYGTGTAGIFSVSMVCDPFWQEISNYVLVGIVLALVGFTGYRYVSKSMQPKYP